MKSLFLFSAFIAGFGWGPICSLQAQTLTTLHGFKGPVNGAFPIAGVTISDGTIYGTAQNGGKWGGGVVFAINTDGTGVTILHNFSALNGNTNVDGANPGGLLTLEGGSLYGTTQYGGGGGEGTVFRINTDGSGFTNLHNFSSMDVTTATNLDGANPQGKLSFSGNTLFGTCTLGGTGAQGAIFAIKTDGSGFTNLHNFSALNTTSINRDGAQPVGGLVLSGNTLYGGTQTGGAGRYGTVFAMNTDGSSFSNLHNFMGNTTDGAAAGGALIVSGSTLYGTTAGGGIGNAGTVFAINTNGSGYTNLYHFTALTGSGATNTDGASSYGGLLLSSGKLYGTTYYGGNWGFGTVFTLSTNGTGFLSLHSFTGGEGHSPYASLAFSGGKVFGTTEYGGVAGSGAVFSMNTDGSGYASLYSFSASEDGTLPQSALILAGKTFYGTAEYGGSFGGGTVYKVNADGSDFTLLHAFTNTDGIYPVDQLTLSGGTLYGATADGGAEHGAIFAVNTDGTGFVNLHRFSAFTIGSAGLGTNSDGAFPNGSLVQSGNILYGTTQSGGVYGNGVIFAVNTDGTHFTNLYNFSTFATGTINPDGANPAAGLFIAGRTLYGEATSGGTHASGTLFKINTDGTGFANLHNFPAIINDTNSEGGQLYGGVILSGSTLYGAASAGGKFGAGTLFKVNTDGSGFSVLHHFTKATGRFTTNYDGTSPYANLVLSGNTLFGTANIGGKFGNGTVFAINTDGSGFTNLYDFTGGGDGANPVAGLILSTNVLYGTAQYGGAAGVGTVFSLALPLPQLAISTYGTNVIVTWPNTSAGFSLHATPSLVPPVVWTPVSPMPAIVNGQNGVTNSISGPQLFYQLFQ